jgi:hypothetical protein
MTSEQQTERWIHALLDGTISPDDHACLQQVLLKNRDARRTYYALVCTDQMLVDTYETGDGFALHRKKSAAGEWSRRKLRGRPVLWSLAAAAVVMLMGLCGLLLVQARVPQVRLAGSADSRFLLDSTAGGGEWRPGQTLEVKHGVVLARLNPFTEAFIEGPSRLVLLESRGAVELAEGRAYFRVSPGAPDFEVRAGGASLRHIGTEFGVMADATGHCELHVMSGSVAITREGEPEARALRAGEAIGWTASGALDAVEVAAGGFQKSLPREAVLFEDNFDDPIGTPLFGKRPDVGQPWMVVSQKGPLHVGGGRLDTSGAVRKLTAGFRSVPGEQSVVLVSLSLTEPERTEDKRRRLNGTESITLWAADGSEICSVAAHARDGHRWRLHDGAGGSSGPTDLHALGRHEITLRYDASTGAAVLHAGGSAQAPAIAEARARANAVPVSLTLHNDDGGDLALTRLAVRAVRYGRLE